ncbi:uncharacterized protein LOC116342847 [Contarinia nasturtii]|uniref:uncharacterized protein LOC116342847 n=1 Tax=Contarinia nasturtii TaxID=265458 RepID=UPI0012D381B0|nr:uncharacterized protein LOC116342847 [Contarinia nasturtii]XP_031626479.1 uncharacterized protein LOC116342847 [Contarinia nasturtii]
MSPATSQRCNLYFSKYTNQRRAMKLNSCGSSKQKPNENSNRYKSKLSITTGKCSSINPYRIFILLVIGLPGLNIGLSSVLTKSVALGSTNFDSTTSKMYIFSTPTRSSAPMLATNSQSNGIRLSQTQTDLLSRNKDTTNMSDKIASKNFKVLSKMKLPQQQQQQQQRQQQIVSLNQGSSFNSNNNKLREDVISQQQQSTTKEAVVSASNAVAAELKGAPMLLIHENDNSSSSNIDGHFNHNTLDEYYKEPMYFGTENSTTVNTQIGATAHLECKVHNIGEGVVSWVRRRDFHLITVSLITYSSDERYSVSHAKNSEDWTLQIKYVQLRDAGVYECSVSVHPPTSIFIYLNVVEARAEIVGKPLRYLTPGSTLKLMCRIVQNTEASAFIFWYHDNRMINYDVDRGINVSTEADYHYSELTIERTNREHSGNYTCVPSNAQPAFVLVHIFKGDNPAAMYHEHRGSACMHGYEKSHFNMIAIMIVITFLRKCIELISNT